MLYSYGNNAYCAHIYIDLDHVMYYRQMQAGIWGGWDSPASKSDFSAFQNGINALGNYTSINQMLKNGYYYIPSEVAADYTGHLIVTGYEGSSGTIRKAQLLIQKDVLRWRTISGTLYAPSFGEWSLK